MSISKDVIVFPNNVASLFIERFSTLDPDLNVVPRRLRTTDANESVGVWPRQWTPDADGYEMNGQLGGSEPTISRYTLVVEGFIKDMDEEVGLVRHAVLAKMIRSMLYRDTTLRISLRALSVTLFGTTERTQRYGIATQRYLSAELTGSFMYLSTLDFWIETETF